jgi:ferredoxin
MTPTDRQGEEDEPGSFEKVTILIEGEPSPVPASVTILDALILSGHHYLRGCGCRVGDCGECAVMVRPPEGGPAVSELACAARVRPGVDISHMPFQWNRAFQNRRRTRR